MSLLSMYTANNLAPTQGPLSVLQSYNSVACIASVSVDFPPVRGIFRAAFWRRENWGKCNTDTQFSYVQKAKNSSNLGKDPYYGNACYAG